MRPKARHWALAFAVALGAHAAAGWLWPSAPRGGGAAAGGGGPVRLVLGAPTGAEGAGTAAPLNAPAPASVNAPPPRDRARPAAAAATPRPASPPHTTPVEVASALPAVVPPTLPKVGAPPPAPSAAGLGAPPAAAGGTAAPGGSGSASDQRTGDGRGPGEDYLTSLVAKVSAALRYPSRARRRGVRGEVLVRVRIDRTGALRDAQVLRSSGSSLLDRDALRTLRRAAPFGRVPGDFESRELEFEIPIQYALE